MPDKASMFKQNYIDLPVLFDSCQSIKDQALIRLKILYHYCIVCEIEYKMKNNKSQYYIVV